MLLQCTKKDDSQNQIKMETIQNHSFDYKKMCFKNTNDLNTILTNVVTVGIN